MFRATASRLGEQFIALDDDGLFQPGEQVDERLLLGMMF
jgi:hypothetical protein